MTATGTNGPPAPLAGIKVLELANFISGPYAACLLADLGADVTKVENPAEGDAYRAWGTEERSPSFFAFNRGKRSIALNLKHEAAQRIALDLAREADVLVENFRPGWLDAHGLSYADVAAVNPRIVYCQISGFGESGPDRDKPAYDGVAQAVSGMWSHLSGRDREWTPVGPPLADQLCGMFGAYGVLGALYERERTGHGTLVSTDMVSAALGFLTSSVAEYTVGHRVRSPYDRAHSSLTFGFECADEKAFAVHLSSPSKFWDGLLRVAGRLDLNDDERFSTRRQRVLNYDVAHAALAEVFRTKPRDHWIRRLEEENVPVGPINDMAEALDDPQVRHNGTVRSFGAGDRALTLVGSPVRFGEDGRFTGPSGGDRAEPWRGEDTVEVLRTVGVTDEEIARLAAEGAIGVGQPANDA